tara:strand:- start:456 stop:851 length:396 start_codon:yes stop_codon:yes gene_type:complete
MTTKEDQLLASSMRATPSAEAAAALQGKAAKVDAAARKANAAAAAKRQADIKKVLADKEAKNRAAIRAQTPKPVTRKLPDPSNIKLGKSPRAASLQFDAGKHSYTSPVGGPGKSGRYATAGITVPFGGKKR